jgi:hypothetical protein
MRECTQAATHLNGKSGTLLREEPASGRWVLALAEGGTIFDVIQFYRSFFSRRQWQSRRG